MRKSTHTQKSFQTYIFPFVLIQRESSQCVFRQKKTERFALKRLSLFLCLVKATEKRGYDESLSVIFCANPCSHPASVKKGTFQTLLFSLRFHSFQSRKCTQFSGVVNKPASFGDALGSILEDHRPEKEK